MSSQPSFQSFEKMSSFQSEVKYKDLDFKSLMRLSHKPESTNLQNEAKMGRSKLNRGQIQNQLKFRPKQKFFRTERAKDFMIDPQDSIIRNHRSLEVKNLGDLPKQHLQVTLDDKETANRRQFEHFNYIIFSMASQLDLSNENCPPIARLSEASSSGLQSHLDVLDTSLLTDSFLKENKKVESELQNLQKNTSNPPNFGFKLTNIGKIGKEFSINNENLLPLSPFSISIPTPTHLKKAASPFNTGSTQKPISNFESRRLGPVIALHRVPSLDDILTDDTAERQSQQQALAM